MNAQPQGNKSIRELRSIVDARLRVWDELAVVWDELLDAQQDELLATARTMAAQTAAKERA